MGIAVKTVTLLVPPQHMHIQETKLVFKHAWRGQELFWIVPIFYVVKYQLKDHRWHVQLSQAYFDRPTNSLAA